MAARFLKGMAIGAVSMYLLDPRQGRRRRALVRDKLVRAEHLGEAAVNYGRRDVANRARGLVAEVRARMRAEPVDDEILAERVRARVGRVVSHPHALEVRAHEGVVTVGGPILDHEAAKLLAIVRDVRGVAGVLDGLQRFADPSGTPALQGEGRPVRYEPPWPPPLRIAATSAGGLLCARALSSRGLLGLVAGGIGGYLLLRGLTGIPAEQWVQRAIEPRMHQMTHTREGRQPATPPPKGTDRLMH